SGILSAMRWKPDVSWLVAACDMPLISSQALEWLLSKRKPGIWAIMPSLTGEGDEIEPLLSYYDMRVKTVFESLARNSLFSVARISDHEKVLSPEPPLEIRKAWKNINSLKDLALVMSQFNIMEE
ncbi:MAG: NTP transferase domain-containing protein, partial [Planctomycetota bacterium]